MTRILRIINRLNLGGPTYNAALLTRHLPPGYETLLVAGVKQDSEESSDFIVENMGLTYRQLPEMRRELNLWGDRNAYLKIREIIREFNPDIVHTHAAKPGALGRLAAFHEKVPVIVHTFHGHVFHSYFGKMKTKLFLEIERSLARKSSAIVAISEKQKEDLVNQYRIADENKIRVVPLGFDLGRFRENREEKRKNFRTKYHLADDEIAIGIIGRLVPIKNHSFFLRVVGELVKGTSRKVKVLVIGDGEEREKLLACCRELALDFTYYPDEDRAAQVIFTSWIKEVDVALAGLDVVALTSFNEGTPVSLIEAQAGGKPVVSTRVGGVEDVVKEGQTGLLCDSGDTKSFVNHLLRLVQDDSLRAEMGGRGWDHVREKYHYTRLVADMQRLYEELLSSRGRNSK